jgi:hypothetical protein
MSEVMVEISLQPFLSEWAIMKMLREQKKTNTSIL